MRILLLVFVSLLGVSASYSATNGQATSFSDVLTYDSISAYSDGTTMLIRPKAYNYYFGADNRGNSAKNAQVVCKMVGMNSLTYEVTYLNGDRRTIYYTLDQFGQISEPTFAWSGDQYTGVLFKVICKPSK